MRSWQRLGVASWVRTGQVVLLGMLCLCQLSYASGMKRTGNATSSLSITDPNEDALTGWNDSDSIVGIVSHDTSLILQDSGGVLTLGVVVPVPIGSGGTGSTTQSTAEIAITGSAGQAENYVYTIVSGTPAWAVNPGTVFTSTDSAAYLTTITNDVVVGSTTTLTNGSATSKVSIIGGENQHQLTIKGYTVQTNDMVRILDSSSNPIFRISGDGAVIATPSATPQGVFTLGSTGVILKDDRDGMLIMQGNSTGQDESLGFNFDDTANIVTVSTDTGVTYMSYDAIGIHIGGAAVPRVVALTDGATPALDASLGNHFFLSAAGNRTVAAPTNPFPGQKIVIAHLAVGADRTLSIDSASAGGYRFGTDITGPLSATTSGKMDYLGFIYDGEDSKWDLTAYRKGY